MSEQRSDLKSFYSSAAQRGMSGYWEFPEMNITWRASICFESLTPSVSGITTSVRSRSHGPRSARASRAEPATSTA